MLANRKPARALESADRLLAHELEHVAQHERWGLLYYPVYLLGSVRGYRRNPFERRFRSFSMGLAAMKAGAYHYANKPFNLDEIALLVDKALETTRLQVPLRAGWG